MPDYFLHDWSSTIFPAKEHLNIIIACVKVPYNSDKVYSIILVYVEQDKQEYVYFRAIKYGLR